MVSTVVGASIVGACLLLGSWVVTRAIQCRESGLTHATLHVGRVLEEATQAALETGPGQLAEEIGAVGARVTMLEHAVELLPSTYDEFYQKAHREANRAQKYYERAEKAAEDRELEDASYPSEDLPEASGELPGPPAGTSEPLSSEGGLGWEERLFLRQHGNLIGGEG